MVKSAASYELHMHSLEKSIFCCNSYKRVPNNLLSLRKLIDVVLTNNSLKLSLKIIYKTSPHHILHLGSKGRCPFWLWTKTLSKCAYVAIPGKKQYLYLLQPDSYLNMMMLSFKSFRLDYHSSHSHSRKPLTLRELQIFQSTENQKHRRLPSPSSLNSAFLSLNIK